MASPLVLIHRILGFAAARRGRTLSGGSPQHNGERFSNVAPRPVEGLGKTLGIAWNMLFNKPRNTVPAGALPVDSLTRAELDAAPDRSLYRLGHSTLLLKLRGEFWLTDPVFAERASPFRRVGPKRFHAPPISLEDLPPLRGVILSHDHYDHLDRDTVLALAATTDVFVTTLGVGDRLIEWGIDAKKVRQLDWWQSVDVTGLTLTATPAQHFSGRSLFDGNSTLWASWVIVDDDLRVFFSGDTGYFDGFRTIGERLGPFDVTLIVRAHAAGRDRAGAHRFARTLADPDPQRHVRSRDASLAGTIRARHGTGDRPRRRSVDAQDGRAPCTRRAASRRAVVAHGRRARDVRFREIAPLDALRVAGHEVRPSDRCPFFPGARQCRDSGRRVAGVPARRRAVCRPDS